MADRAADCLRALQPAFGVVAERAAEAFETTRRAEARLAESERLHAADATANAANAEKARAREEAAERALAVGARRARGGGAVGVDGGGATARRLAHAKQQAEARACARDAEICDLRRALEIAEKRGRGVRGGRRRVAGRGRGGHREAEREGRARARRGAAR